MRNLYVQKSTFRQGLIDALIPSQNELGIARPAWLHVASENPLLRPSLYSLHA